MYLGSIRFVFEEAPSTTSRPPSSLSVVGIHAYIYNDSWPSSKICSRPVNFDVLVNHARTSPTIRATVFLFDAFDRLQESMKPFIRVLGAETEAINFVLAYEEEEKRRAVGVDPVTLEANGA